MTIFETLRQDRIALRLLEQIKIDRQRVLFTTWLLNNFNEPSPINKRELFVDPHALDHLTTPRSKSCQTA